MAKKKFEKVICNSCGHGTKHLLIATRKHAISDFIENYGEVSWVTTYDLFECCGCESVTLRRGSFFSETGEEEYDFYPPVTSRRLPQWHTQLPKKISSLLKEIYMALNSSSLRLATMGARAVLDMVMLDKIGDVGNFKCKLNALEKEEFVGGKSRRFLETALDMGNAVSHRGHAPRSGTVNQVMEIVENLLQSVYVLEAAAEEIKSATPPRNRQLGKVASKSVEAPGGQLKKIGPRLYKLGA